VGADGNVRIVIKVLSNGSYNRTVAKMPSVTCFKSEPWRPL